MYTYFHTDIKGDRYYNISSSVASCRARYRLCERTGCSSYSLCLKSVCLFEKAKNSLSFEYTWARGWTRAVIEVKRKVRPSNRTRRNWHYSCSHLESSPYVWNLVKKKLVFLIPDKRPQIVRNVVSLYTALDLSRHRGSLVMLFAMQLLSYTTTYVTGDIDAGGWSVYVNPKHRQE